VTEIPLLCLIESFKAMISLPLRSDLVLAHVVRNAKAGDTEHDDLSTKIDAVADRIARRIADEVRPSRSSLAKDNSACVHGYPYVARTPPSVPTDTIHAVATARTAGPAESAKR
jgi:hypothetical protein